MLTGIICLGLAVIIALLFGLNATLRNDLEIARQQLLDIDRANFKPYILTEIRYLPTYEGAIVLEPMLALQGLNSSGDWELRTKVFRGEAYRIAVMLEE